MLPNKPISVYVCHSLRSCTPPSRVPATCGQQTKGDSWDILPVEVGAPFQLQPHPDLWQCTLREHRASVQVNHKRQVIPPNSRVGAANDCNTPCKLCNTQKGSDVRLKRGSLATLSSPHPLISPPPQILSFSASPAPSPLPP